MMESITVNNQLTITSTNKSKVEKLFKVERKHRQIKNKGARHFIRIKTKNLNRTNIREKLSIAHEQHVAKDEVIRNYTTASSVNIALALYFSRNIF